MRAARPAAAKLWRNLHQNYQSLTDTLVQALLCANSPTPHDATQRHPPIPDVPTSLLTRLPIPIYPIPTCPIQPCTAPSPSIPSY